MHRTPGPLRLRLDLIKQVSTRAIFGVVTLILDEACEILWEDLNVMALTGFCWHVHPTWHLLLDRCVLYPSVVLLLLVC